MGLLLGLLLGGVVVVAVAVKRRAPGATEGGDGAPVVPKSPGQRIKQALKAKDEVESGGMFAGSDMQMEWAAAGGALGGAAAGLVLGAAAGPIGALIGTAAGFFVGAFISAVGQPTFARIVRDRIADWCRESGYAADAEHVDAILYRNAILGSRLWLSQSGEVAVEIVRQSGRLELSLFRTGPRTGALEPILPGQIDSQSRQQIAGYSDGQLDGPVRRRRLREWKARWAIGQLYRVRFDAPQDSWRTPGYVFFGAVWPVVSSELVPVRDGWAAVEVTRDNVEAVAVATFDRAAGISWEKEGASS